MLKMLLIALVCQPAAKSVNLDVVLKWKPSYSAPASYDEMEKVISLALETNSDLEPAKRKELLLRRGYIRSMVPRLGRAETDFDECKRISPDDNVVQCYSIFAKFNDADSIPRGPDRQLLQVEARRRVKRHPNDPLALFTLSQVVEFNPSNGITERVKILRRLSKTFPDFVDAHLYLAHTQIVIHDYDGCIATIDAVLPRLKSYETERINVALVRKFQAVLATGDFAKAASGFAQVCNSDPNVGTPRCLLWICDAELGKIDESRKIVNELMREFPEDIEPRALRAIMLANDDKIEEAKQEVRQISVRAGMRAANLRSWALGRIADQAGEFSDAVIYYEDVLDSLVPIEFDEFARLDAQFRLPLILAAADDRKVRRGLRAEHLAKELVSILADGPAQRKAELILACALAEQGDFEKALEYVGAVAKQPGLAPDEAETCRQLTALFEDETPYRISADRKKARILDIPTRACYFGPLKKIEVADD